MKPFPVPVVGAGSQPDEAPLDYLAAPGPMATFRAPLPRGPVSAAALAGAHASLHALVTEMSRTPFGAPSMPNLDLTRLDPGVVQQINELLGEGEVACRTRFQQDLRIQETAFAGVWRVQGWRDDRSIAIDEVDTGPFPRRVMALLAAHQSARPPEMAAPAGIMNGASLLHEVRERASALAPGDPVHVVNLTLLPVNDQDLAYLQAQLGEGPVDVLSRGYGNCRIRSTAIPRVWWVQYFNSMDQIILNTIEVVDLPEVALAAAQDYEDSRLRLVEWLTTLQEDAA